MVPAEGLFGDISARASNPLSFPAPRAGLLLSATMGFGARWFRRTSTALRRASALRMTSTATARSSCAAGFGVFFDAINADVVGEGEPFLYQNTANTPDWRILGSPVLELSLRRSGLGGQHCHGAQWL